MMLKALQHRHFTRSMIENTSSKLAESTGMSSTATRRLFEGDDASSHLNSSCLDHIIFDVYMCTYIYIYIIYLLIHLFVYTTNTVLNTL